MTTSRRRIFRRLLNLERFEERLVPALITVFNLNSSGAGSFRDAIGSANSTPGADTIDFAPGLTGVINLNPGVGGASLNINEAVTIFGPGAGVISVTANGKSRVFNLSGAASGSAIYISGLNITGGRAVGTVNTGGVGAGIFIENENVTIDRCRISGNVADKSGGGIAIGQHYYIGGGGSASVSIYNSTISGNSALEGGGGGISVYGESFGPYAKRAHSLWVETSTISGNTANWSLDQTSYVGGGGVSFRGKVGPGYLAFANTTITNNTATKGAVGAAILGIALNGTINFLNSTIAYNQAERPGSSGIRIQQNFDTSAGNMQAQSSIIANNTQIGGAESRDLSSLFATTLTAFDCIIGNATYTGVSVQGTGNQTGTATVPLDSKLGPLQDNGGPNFTRMPLAGSPAVNKGSLAILVYNPTTDGRGVGYPRSLDGAIDVGAVELTDWVVRNNKDKDSGSLNQRILDANAFVGEQTITFDPAVFPSNKSTMIQSPGGTPISDSLTITGPGAAALTLQRSGPVDSMFRANAAGLGDVITMSGLTFSAGEVTGNGGVIISKGQTLNFTDCVFTKNTASSGGAIAFDSSASNQLNLLRCSFTNNTADLNGGAVFIAGGGGLSIIDSTFSGNQTKAGTTTSHGGGAVAFAGTASAPLVFRNSTFAGNTAVGLGGAIFVNLFIGTLNVENSTIANNTASTGLSQGGGGIARFGGTGTITLNNSIVSNNIHTTGANEDLYSAGEINANSCAIGVPNAVGMNSDATTTALLGKNFRLGTLGSFGGPTQTIPLLPGSPLFNAGSSTVTLDQRGKSRVGAADIGAFESQGFTVSVVSGTPQTSVTNLAFGSPLVAKIVAVDAIEPVDGGVITFTPPASGASATLGTPAAVIAAGSASTTATANNIGGSYNVTASAGSSSVNYALTNKAPEIPSLIVTTNLDIVDNFDYKTSLREAIALSNSKVGVDTITFDAAVFATPQTIALTTGELALNDAVTITGPGLAQATVSGNKVGRVFNTTAAAANAAINISGLTIANAQTALRGGAVFADDQFLTFTDCVLTGNSSGAGGAIAFDVTTTGRLTLQRTTVSNNTASFGGGGVYFFGGGSFNIQNSTFSGNKSNSTIAGNGGGGIYFNGSAGTKTLEVRNSTISGNTALSDGGGICIRNHGGVLYMANSTVVNNSASGQQGGGGIAQVDSTGSWNISSSIISNNAHTAGPSEDLLNLQTGFVGSLSSCAIGTAVGIPNVTLSGSTSTLLGKNFLFAPLGNYGGPTQTHALLPGSPAIDQGVNNLGLTTDQRGQPRVSITAPDVGAFESQGFTVSVFSGSPQSASPNTNFPNPLVAGVSAKNAIEPVNGGIVTFAAPPSGASATLGAPSATIAGGSASTTAKSNTLSGGYNVSASVAGSSVNFALTNKFAEAPSHIVTTNIDVVDPFDQETSLRESIELANKTPGLQIVTFDTAFFSTPRTITLASTLSITGETTLTGPGADRLTLSGNNAVRVMKIDTPTSGQKITVSRLTIANGFSIQGGGVFIGDESVLLQDCALVNNSASSQIGAVLVGLNANVVLERCAVTGNSAPTIGGIYSASPIVIRNSTIANNTANISTAIFIGGSASLVLENSTVVGNKADTGGAGVVSSASVTSTGSVISGNTSDGIPNDVFFPVETLKLTATNSAIGVITKASEIIDLGGNIFNQPHASLLLAPLANNGGPTQTIALLPGSPLINKGSNPAGLTTDQRGVGFNRVNGGAADIGAFESKLPPSVRNVMINDGSAQRSRVNSVTVEFDSVVTFSGAPVNAFSLKRQSDSAVPVLSATVTNGATTSVVLTFLAGPAAEFGSLADGRYTLTVNQSQVSTNGSQLDGNVDGIAGDNFVLTGSPTNGLFRLFGDADGNGTVTASDFNAFRLAYGSTGPSIFDFDGDNQVSASDFNQFRTRYGVTI